MLSQPRLDSSTDTTTIQTWTTRGITDPYRVGRGFKRGRGRARTYSFRDVLKFNLMTQLHKRYRMPLPRGKDICRMAFGDSFNPEKARFGIITATPISASVDWTSDEASLIRKLSDSPVEMVVNVGVIHREMSIAATKLLRDREEHYENT